MILVSACLAGITCRYDGKDNAVDEIVKLVKEGRAIPLCPEVLGNLPIPRIPCEIIGGDDGRRVVDREGTDRTEAFHKGAGITGEICLLLEIKEAVLKSGSPSCGCRRIYDGTFTGRKIPGQGITAELLARRGIAVYNEEEWAAKS